MEHPEVGKSIADELIEFLQNESKKQRTRKEKKQKVDEAYQIHQVQAELETSQAQLKIVEAQVKQIQKRFGKLRNREKPKNIAVENHVNPRNRPYPSAEQTTAQKQEPTICLWYIVDGKAGFINFDLGQDTISVEDIFANINRNQAI